MAKLKDIAKKCGVSNATVSLAFHHPHKISKAVRDKVLNTAKEMGFFVKKERHIKRVLLVFDDFEMLYFNEFYQEIIFGILNRLSELKKEVHISNKFNLDSQDIYNYSGILFVGKTPDAYIDKAIKHQIPHLLAGHPNYKYASPAIYNDNFEGTELMLDYLASCGHKKIALVLGETNKEDVLAKNTITAYKDTLEKLGLKYDKKLVFQANYNEIQSVDTILNKIISQKDKITAIVCANDLLAYYTMKAAEKYDISIPQDISLTGFDGVTLPRHCRNYPGKLTTVFVDRKKMGRNSVDLLMKEIKKPGSVPKRNMILVEPWIRDTVKRIK